jgi:isopentenyl-diphosphate delta-isomerase
MTDTREKHDVELVDDGGSPIGVETVDEAHRRPGRLHRAFSVLLTDADGRMLLQRRSAAKTRFPLRWANACCGHPTPGQSVTVAATRRLREEIGLEPVPLTEVGVYVYYAEDPATGRVEFEYDHVLLGTVSADVPLLPDPDEVADLQWMTRRELAGAVRKRPRSFAPWLPGVLARLAEYEAAGGGRSSSSGRRRSSGAKAVAEVDGPGPELDDGLPLIDGATVDGAVDSVPVDSVPVDGVPADGAAVDGLAVDGRAVNDLAVSEAAGNEAAGSSGGR